MSSSGVPSRQSRPTTESVPPSTLTSRTTLMAIGLGRTGERSAKVPRCDAVMARHLEHQIAARLVHPVEHHQMAAGLDVLERLRPARIDLDGADRVGFAGVLRAVLALASRACGCGR